MIFLFIATVSYVMCSGYKKTLSYSHFDESVVNDWLTSKLKQLSRLNCTNAVGSYCVV